MTSSLLKVFAILRYYPIWVQILFYSTLGLLLLSVILFFYFLPAARAQQDSQLIEASISVEVSVMSPQPTLPPTTDDPFTLTYVSERDSSARIEPRMTYLTTLLNSGPICDAYFWYSPFTWEFPNLDIKVVNNSDKAILLSEAAFDVGRSSPDLRPIIVIRADRQQRNARHFELRNEGWGDVESCTIRYGVEPWHETWSRTSDAISEEALLRPTKYEAHIVRFKESSNVDASEGIAKEGAKLAELDRLLTNPPAEMTEEEWDKQTGEAAGPFAIGAALVYGALDYSWTRADATVAQERIRFFTQVFIGNMNRLGLPKLPSWQYQVRLETSRSEYSVALPISHELKPGDSDRFNIRVGAEVSSFHLFNLTLSYNDDLTLSPVSISLQMFVPRSGSRRAILATGT